jgi:hypothetical protein
MRIELLASAVLSFALAACSSAPPLPPLDSKSPASPDAPEAPLPPTRNAFGDLDAGAPPPPAGHEHHHGAAAAAGAYVCPMHEEVSSDAPGACPRCRMALVKRPVQQEKK